MERTGRTFDEFLKTYKEGLSGPEEAFFNAKSAQFAIANELIERRKAAGLTQIQLAEATGVSQPEISRIERGDKNATILTLNKIAQVLKVRVGLVNDPRIH